MEKLGKLLRAKLRNRKNNSINAEPKSKVEKREDSNMITSIDNVITPQFSSKYLLPQARMKNHLPQRRPTSNAHRLPAIRKSYNKPSDWMGEANKENINPSEYFNGASSDYCNVSLNNKLRKDQRRKKLNALPNGRNQSIDAKRTKLTLPDDSNYNKIVSFVKDIKDTINTQYEYRAMTPCNEIQHKFNKQQKQETLCNVSVVNPLNLSRSPRRRAKTWVHKFDEGMLKRLTLFPMMKLGFDAKRLELTVQDIIFII